MCMNVPLYSGISLALILIGYSVFIKLWYGNLYGLPSTKLPPGPRGLPIVGNMFQFSRARNSGNFVPYLLSMREYGEMTTLHMGSQTWILLNSDRVISDIINKNSRITNERPYMPIAGELVSHNKRLVVRQTQECSEARRVIHHLLSTSALKSYYFWQELESCQLLLSYLERPERWYRHHFRFATAVFYEIIMGVRLEKGDKELDDYQQVTMEFLFSLFRSPVDFFPKLASLPGCLQFWRAKWKVMGDFHRSIHEDWWKPVQSAIKKGALEPSFVRDVLLNPETKYTGNDEEAMYLATSVMAAGGDNTRMTLNVFVMSVICYPDIYQRAREEIDSVCMEAGSMRLPCLDDMNKMPYLSAVIKEVLRWRPTVPLIPPHELTEDLSYEGFHFPKGTIFMINNIAASNEHKNSDKFQPERWLDGNENNLLHGLWAFGGGRRACIGYRVEQQVLFMALSRLIFCFDYTPNGEYNSNMLNPLTLNEPFPVRVRPRSQQHADFIRKVAEGQGVLRR